MFVDLRLGKVQIAQTNLIAKVDHVGIAILQLEVKRLLRVFGELPQGLIEWNKGRALVQGGEVIHEQCSYFYYYQEMIHIGIEVTDLALFLDCLLASLTCVQKFFVID